MSELQGGVTVERDLEENEFGAGQFKPKNGS
jgi:hypothetical protein